MRKAVPLSGVTGDAGADNVFPSRLSSTVPRKDMVDVQVATIEEIPAVLACIPITFENIQPCEFDLFFWQSVKKG
jgi:hypothetical protein